MPIYNPEKFTMGRIHLLYDLVADIIYWYRNDRLKWNFVIGQSTDGKVAWWCERSDGFTFDPDF